VTTIIAPERQTAATLGSRVEAALRRRIVGQDAVIDRLLIALLAGGHVLLEGVPGLAKTLMVRSLADALAVDFRRIQFTPDLLPSDVVGSTVFRPDRGDFVASPGPVFANLVLADELNRAPAKVQSALLEAMQERQVTLGGRTLELPDPFMVLATENPIEQQGTYPLAEAQLDRFLMMVRLDYPGRGDERQILRNAGGSGLREIEPVADAADIRSARLAVREVAVADPLLDYVVDLVRATREPAAVGLSELEGLIEYGASPRAGLALVAAARARAFLRGAAFVVPEDVQALAPDVLRHRLVLSYEATARGVTSDGAIGRILETVPVP
jgi:MoxR-like ATPase